MPAAGFSYDFAMEPQQIVMRRLDLYRIRLAFDLDNYCTPSDEALFQRDPFLLASIFQKALRRAERRFVFGAGKALLLLDPARLWRRLVVCAVEDFAVLWRKRPRKRIGSAPKFGA